MLRGVEGTERIMTVQRIEQIQDRRDGVQYEGSSINILPDTFSWIACVVSLGPILKYA